MREKFINILKKHFILLTFFICFLFSLIFGNINENIDNNYGNIISVIGIFLLFLCFIILDKIKKFKKEYTKIFIFALLFFVYIGYILNTNCATRQHDTRGLDWNNGGHFGYIQYILENSKLPDFNPTEKWCFTNPPLFYIISAIFIKIQNFLGRQGYQAVENLQYLTLFFTIVFDIYVYKILDTLNVEKMKEYIVLFIGLSPAIVYLSGSLNNDILSITLVTISIFYTIQWYKNPKFLDLLKIAISISFAMMTKINSAIVAIPIAIIFFVKLIREKNNLIKYIIYYFIFSLIALPIGLWFPIKNLIKYNIPITYIQTVSEGKENAGYIGEHSVIERFFVTDLEHLKSINLKFEKGESDYNILLTTLKSFIVDEQIDYSNNAFIEIAIYLLFFINLIMVILFLISIFKVNKNVENIFIYLIFILEIIFYIKFCFDYPYAFTMNFRYIVPTIIIIGFGIGKMCDNNSKMFNFVRNLIGIYSLLSIILFISL
ncbi:MAG: glycosyltransferase family 39 protein [Candidatus Scatovivens sp.]